MPSILFLAGFIATCTSHGQTHLHIQNPSTISGNLRGPVKKITEEYNYAMSNRKYHETREYDPAGNLIHRRKTNYKDELTYAATNSFNDAGCLVRQQIDDRKDKKKFDYDIVLNPSTRQMAFKCRITGEIEVSTYNEDRFLMSTTLKKQGAKTQPFSAYKRDANNQPLAYTRYDDDGRIDYVAVYDHDEDGRLLKSVVTYRQEKRTDTNEYEYLSTDEYGNWTQRLLKITSIKDREEKRYEKFSAREIEYYDL